MEPRTKRTHMSINAKATRIVIHAFIRANAT